MWTNIARQTLQLCTILALVHRGMAANGTGSTGQNNQLCNSTMASANASGIFTFAVDYPLANSSQPGQPVINVPDPSWAITVNEQNGTVQSSIWYDTAGQDYSHDLSIDYDACAFLITGGLPLNTLQLGQNDPGDCSSMFSQDCRTAILQKTAASALKWVSYASPPPYSNLSAGVLPSICSYILRDLGHGNFQYPMECAQEFGYTHSINEPTSTLLLPLTGYNESTLDRGSCTLQKGNKTFQSVESNRKAFSTSTYDNMTRSIYPALSVYFPVANINRQVFYSWANSSLSCLRVQNFDAESRVSPALPAGHAYRRRRRRLRKGVIAGLAVGVAAAVVVIAALVAWICLRRRRQAKTKSTAEARDQDHREVYRDKKGVEVDGAGLSELSPTQREAEIDGTTFAELHGNEKPAELGGHTKPAELGDSGKPAELSAGH